MGNVHQTVGHARVVQIDESGLKDALVIASRFHINQIGGSKYIYTKPAEVEIRGNLGSLIYHLDPEKNELTKAREGIDVGKVTQVSISFFDNVPGENLILTYECRRHKSILGILNSIPIPSDVPIVCNSPNKHLSIISNSPSNVFRRDFEEQFEILTLNTFNDGVSAAVQSGHVPGWMKQDLNKSPREIPYPSPAKVEILGPFTQTAILVDVRLSLINEEGKERFYLAAVPPGMEDNPLVPPHVSEEDFKRIRSPITEATRITAEVLGTMRDERLVTLRKEKEIRQLSALDSKFKGTIDSISKLLGIDSDDPILDEIQKWPDVWQKTLKSKDERTQQVGHLFVGKEPQNVSLEDCMSLAVANVVAGAILNRKQKVSRSSEKGIRGVGILCDSWSRKFESVSSSSHIASDYEEALPQLRSRKESLLKTIDTADGAIDLFKSLTTKFETSSIGEILVVLDEMYGLFSRDLEEFLKQNNSVKEYRAYLENLDVEDTLTDELSGEIFGKGISELRDHFLELGNMLGSEERAHIALFDFVGTELFNPLNLINNTAGSILAGVMLNPELPLGVSLINGAKKAIEDLSKEGPISLEEVLFAKKISWLLYVLSASPDETSESGSLMHRLRDFCFTKPDLANRAGVVFRDFRSELENALEEREFEVFGTPIPENGLSLITSAIKELRKLGCEISLPTDLSTVSQGMLREFMTSELPNILETHRAELQTLESELSEAEKFLKDHQKLSAVENQRISNEFKLLRAATLFVERAPRV